MSKNQLFTGAVCEKKFGKQISVYRNVNLKDVMKLVGRSDVVSGTDGRFTVVQDGPERNSLDASWHQDGLSYQYPPKTVLLYCESAGQYDITTDLADVASTLKALDPHNQSMLERMFRCYVSRSG